MASGHHPAYSTFVGFLLDQLVQLLDKFGLGQLNKLLLVLLDKLGLGQLNALPSGRRVAGPCQVQVQNLQNLVQILTRF